METTCAQGQCQGPAQVDLAGEEGVEGLQGNMCNRTGGRRNDSPFWQEPQSRVGQKYNINRFL